MRQSRAFNLCQDSHQFHNMHVYDGVIMYMYVQNMNFDVIPGM